VKAAPGRKSAAVLNQAHELNQTKLVLSHLKHSEQAWCESAHALAADFLLVKKKQQVTLSAADMNPSFGCVHCQEEISTSVFICTGCVQMQVEIFKSSR